jgi:arylformamidase
VTILSFSSEGRHLSYDTTAGLDLSLPVDPQRQNQPFGVAPPTVTPLRFGDTVLDTRSGGSCNCHEYSLITHCHTTHTEGIGHLVDEPVAVSLPDPFMRATLITVEPEHSVVTRAAVDRALAQLGTFRDALILRTGYRASLDTLPASIEPHAISRITEAGINHLLTDLPSLDPAEDTNLSAHREFWGLPPHGRSLNEAKYPYRTITELLHFPRALPDGEYVLQLQLAPFPFDAAPSRPLLFPLHTSKQ